MAHTPVAGYTEQSEDKLRIVNSNKLTEEILLKKIEAIEQTGHADPRSLALAKTYLQTGFMWLNRAVMQPQRLSDEAFAALKNMEE